MKTESIIEAAKAAPPITVGGLTFLGIALADWVLMGSALYTLFLLIDKFPVVVARIERGCAWVKEKFNGSK